MVPCVQKKRPWGKKMVFGFLEIRIWTPGKAIMNMKYKFKYPYWMQEYTSYRRPQINPKWPWLEF